MTRPIQRRVREHRELATAFAFPQAQSFASLTTRSCTTLAMLSSCRAFQRCRFCSRLLATRALFSLIGTSIGAPFSGNLRRLIDKFISAFMEAMEGKKVARQLNRWLAIVI